MNEFPWEKSSTGFGRKMLLAMGWSGEVETIMPIHVTGARPSYDKRGLGYSKKKKAKPPPPPYVDDSNRLVRVLSEMGRLQRLEREQLLLALVILLSRVAK